MSPVIEQAPTKEYLWLVKHPEIEHRYIGEWIAIHHESVVSHSQELDQVLQETAHLSPHPLILRS